MKVRVGPGSLIACASGCACSKFKDPTIRETCYPGAGRPRCAVSRQGPRHAGTARETLTARLPRKREEGTASGADTHGHPRATGGQSEVRGTVPPPGRAPSLPSSAAEPAARGSPCAGGGGSSPDPRPGRAGLGPQRPAPPSAPHSAFALPDASRRSRRGPPATQPDPAWPPAFHSPPPDKI